MATPEVCASAHELTYHSVYRISLFVHLLVSIISMIPLVYFLIFELRKTRFHGNLKSLFASYVISVFLLSLDFGIISIIEILIPLFVTNPCDLLIPSNAFQIGNISVSVFMTLSTFFPIAITIERFIAMKKTVDYESTKVRIGPLLAILSVILDVSIIFWIYKNEKFEDGSISFVFFPKDIAPKMFTFFWFMLLLNFLNFLFDLYILRQNIRMKNSTSSLGTKYQREEIYESTKFSVIVISCHFGFFGLYIIGIMIFRYFGSWLIPDSIDLMAVRGAFTTMISAYNLVVGVVAVYLNRKMKMEKSEEIRGTIRMETTGSAGAQNYEKAIMGIWNSVNH